MTSLILAALIAQPQGAPETIELKVGDVSRQAIIVRPKAGKAPHPVVFGFHGLGGSGRNAARSFNVHSAWPEAVVLYPVGLPTPTNRAPEGDRRGWSGRVGSRDFDFFDALLKHVIEKEKGDAKKVVVMGHSNGGGFTYSLRALRSDKIAAFAPSASAGARPNLAAKPAFLMMGKADTVVPYERQIESLKRLVQSNLRTSYESLPKPTETSKTSKGEVRTWQTPTPLAVYEHPGAHEFPSDAVPAMVEFMKKVLD